MAKAKRIQSEAECCEALGVSPRTLLSYRSDGCPYTKGRGQNPNKYDAAEIAAWMKKNGKTGVPGRPKSRASATKEEAELRKLNAMAENWEIRNAKELRDLLPATEVAKSWQRIAHEVRSKVVNVAAAVAPRLVGLSVSDTSHEIERALREALEAIVPDSEPTTKAKTK